MYIWVRSQWDGTSNAHTNSTNKNALSYIMLAHASSVVFLLTVSSLKPMPVIVIQHHKCIVSIKKRKKRKKKKKHPTGRQFKGSIKCGISLNLHARVLVPMNFTELTILIAFHGSQNIGLACYQLPISVLFH